MACAGKISYFYFVAWRLYLFITIKLLADVRSIFCLSPAGDTPSSARLFDAIVSGCIPVIVSDELELPFEGILDYRKVNVDILSFVLLFPFRNASPGCLKVKIID